eukprot:gene15636-6920_t
MASLKIGVKKHRLSYSVMFKLAAVHYAEMYGNRATARYLGVNEKQIRDWRSKKHSLVQCDSNAKRLKGAGRHICQMRDDLQFEQAKNQMRLKDNAVYDISKNSKIFSAFPGKYLETSNWNSTFSINGLNHNGIYNIEEYYKEQSKGSFAKRKETDREFDFHERFSCALALLELQKGN